jgi:hypothetical protein
MAAIIAMWTFVIVFYAVCRLGTPWIQQADR